MPRRLRRRTRPALGLGELAAGPRRLPRGLVARPLPDRDRAARRRRRRGGRTGRWTSCGACSSAPDGSFPQNSRLDGTPVFGDLQMDEVAFPIVLAHQLGRTGAADWAHVKQSADYVVAHGPQYAAGAVGERDRLLAGDHRRRDRRPGLRGGHRDARTATPASAATYLAKADEWQQTVESMTATTTGPLQPDAVLPARHQERRTRTPATTMQVSDGGPLIDERQVVDPSFLDLVRLGVKRADDPVDPQLASRRRRAAALPDGRTAGSGTGPASTATARQRDGSQWEPTDPGLGHDASAAAGRCWAASAASTRCWPAGCGDRRGTARRRWARAADDGSHLMAEQVWDHNPPRAVAAASRPASRRSRPRRWPGRTRSSCGWPRSSTPGRRSRRRRWWPAATTARPAGADRALIRRCG